MVVPRQRGLALRARIMRHSLPRIYSRPRTAGSLRIAIDRQRGRELLVDSSRHGRLGVGNHRANQTEGGNNPDCDSYQSDETTEADGQSI